MKLPLPTVKGRGAQIQLPNRFTNEQIYQEVNPPGGEKTKYLSVHPKTIINKVDSRDIPYNYSLNPYQGCEHGCVYCYARPTHNFWGYNAGLDFEQVILVKANATQLLEQKLSSKSWQPNVIMLSGNTDCYQPIEHHLKVTRGLLETFWRFRHPVGIITKNALIERDLDVLRLLAQNGLVRVVFSVTGADEQIRKHLEPRTSTYKERFKAIKTLKEAGIPVMVLMAPVIPSINDHEVFEVARLASDHGADDIRFIVVRLNDEVQDVFMHWLDTFYSDKKNRVMNQIKDLHGGQVEDKRYGVRMKGEGELAEVLHQQFKLARTKYFPNPPNFEYNLKLHPLYKTSQLSLF